MEKQYERKTEGNMQVAIVMTTFWVADGKANSDSGNKMEVRIEKETIPMGGTIGGSRKCLVTRSRTTTAGTSRLGFSKGSGCLFSS